MDWLVIVTRMTDKGILRAQRKRRISAQRRPAEKVRTKVGGNQTIVMEDLKKPAVLPHPLKLSQ